MYSISHQPFELSEAFASLDARKKDPPSLISLASGEKFPLGIEWVIRPGVKRDLRISSSNASANGDTDGNESPGIQVVEILPFLNGKLLLFVLDEAGDMGMRIINGSVTFLKPFICLCVDVTSWIVKHSTMSLHHGASLFRHRVRCT